MTPRPAMIRELCILLEGFPPQPLASVLSQSLLSTWRRCTAPGWLLYVEDLWTLLCYSERTHSWPCAKPYYGPRGQCRNSGMVREKKEKENKKQQQQQKTHPTPTALPNPPAHQVSPSPNDRNSSADSNRSHPPKSGAFNFVANSN